MVLCASAIYHAFYWDVARYVFLENCTNKSNIKAPIFRHPLFIAPLQSCYNCRLTFPQLLFLGLCHQSTRFIALSKIVIPRDILLAIIHFSMSMLSNSNREDRELTNVGEMVRLRSVVRRGAEHIPLSNRLGSTWGSALEGDSIDRQP